MMGKRLEPLPVEAQLDALPTHAVVMDAHGVAWQKTSGVWCSAAQSTQCLKTAALVAQSQDRMGEVQVWLLHDGHFDA